jgi:hypothetical protein
MGRHWAHVHDPYVASRRLALLIGLLGHFEKVTG